MFVCSQPFFKVERVRDAFGEQSMLEQSLSLQPPIHLLKPEMLHVQEYFSIKPENHTAASLVAKCL